MERNSTRNFLLVILGILQVLIVVAAIMDRVQEKPKPPQIGLDDHALELAKPLIIAREGLRLEAYKDGEGYSIGHGHHGVNEGDTITQEQAGRFLLADMMAAIKGVKDRVTVDLNACQLAVLTSWAYNFSPYRLEGSGLLAAVNEKRFGDVPEELRLWVHHEVNGKMVASDWLVQAREEEVKLWHECEND